MVRQPKADLHSIISCSNNLPPLQCCRPICISDSSQYCRLSCSRCHSHPTTPPGNQKQKYLQKFLWENIWILFMVPDHLIINYDVERDNSNHLWRLCNSELTNATVPSILKLNKVISRSKNWKFRGPPFFSKLIGNNHVQMWASWWDTPHPSRNNKHSSLLLVRDTFRWTTVTFYRQLLAWSPPACSEDVNIGRRAGVLHFVVPALIRRKLLMRF